MSCTRSAIHALLAAAIGIEKGVYVRGVVNFRQHQTMMFRSMKGGDDFVRKYSDIYTNKSKIFVCKLFSRPACLCAFVVSLFVSSKMAQGTTYTFQLLPITFKLSHYLYTCSSIER